MLCRLRPLSTFIFLTGVRVTPGGPAELCQLRADDEIPTVAGDLAAHLRSGAREKKMASAPQTGAHTADVRGYEKKGELRNEGLLASFLLI